ncbi:MAG TPA: sensor histidine kinase [Symbiobacteriaceae bacterium]|nr:sensor histidine kinase [Symbiobacteriaceae bacterium]
MPQPDRSITTQRRLLLHKWLMIFMPPVTVLAGHSLLVQPLRHTVMGIPVSPLVENLIVAFLLLVLVYALAQSLFRILWRLQAEALAHEQAVLTMNAVMQERERLSRELHDGVAQLVAHLLLRLDTIKGLVEADRKREAETELERLRGVADEIYADIGESISGLRTNLAEQGLVRTLQDYADQFEERYQIPVSLCADAAADQFAPLAAFQVFRLVQEALTNVRKHAGARQSAVVLALDGPDQLRVEITDDGQGFAAGSQPSGTARQLGLTSMRERAEALGGTFRVDTRPGAGTQVAAAIPISPHRR